MNRGRRRLQLSRVHVRTSELHLTPRASYVLSHLRAYRLAMRRKHGTAKYGVPAYCGVIHPTTLNKVTERWTN